MQPIRVIRKLIKIYRGNQRVRKLMSRQLVKNSGQAFSLKPRKRALLENSATKYHQDSLLGNLRQFKMMSKFESQKFLKNFKTRKKQIIFPNHVVCLGFAWT